MRIEMERVTGMNKGDAGMVDTTSAFVSLGQMNDE